MDKQDSRATLPHLGDVDAELFWHLASYVGGFIIEWSRLERAIDLLVYHSIQRRKEKGVKCKMPGDFSKKLEILSTILEENDHIKGKISWLYKMMPRILELKKARDSFVHGYLQSASDNPATVSFNKKHYRESRDKLLSISISDIEFQNMINDIIYLERHIGIYLMVFITNLSH